MKRVTLFILILLLLAVPAGTALAAPPFDTTVGENETVNNDVIVFDGDLNIEQGAVVNGDVVVFNGDVFSAGTINGDLVIFNGDLEVEDAALISGDCVLLNGDVAGESAGGLQCTNIEGSVISGLVQGIPPVVAGPKAVPDTPSIPAIPDVPDIPAIPDAPSVAEPSSQASHSNAGIDFAGVLSSTLLMGFLAYAAGALFPKHLQEVKTTARSKPFASGAVGVLTAIAVPVLAAILAVISAVLVIICIGLLGFPIVLLMLLALVAGGVFGWIAIGTWLGEKLLRNSKRSLATKAALGTMILTFALGLFGMLPFVWGEGILVSIISAIGLGAVALTQFGRKPYPPQDGGEVVVEDAVKIASVLDTLPDDDLDEGPAKA
ncbi:MAG: hypothetical protein ACK2UK_02395 [Candidatus Promineifilaceae bacterium]